jgi:formate hydrogenlyase transcriptional activator
VGARAPALAIDSAFHFEASQKAQAELTSKNERLELVLDLTNRVVSNLNLRDLLRTISASVRRVMKCDAAGVALPDAEGNQFRIYALDFPDSKGFLTAESLVPIEGSPLGAAFRTGEPQLILCGEEPACPNNAAIREVLKTGCFLPLMSHNRVLGVLALSRFTEDPFTREDVAFLSQVAMQIAIAVENALESSIWKTRFAASSTLRESWGRARRCATSCNWWRRWPRAIPRCCCWGRPGRARS